MTSSLQDLLRSCTETEQNYRKISASLVAYIKDTTKNIKLQKPIVDYIKVVIKSKKHTSFQKVLALRLLNKCIEAGIGEFNRYVEKKVLKRLLIFAEHNKDKNTENDLLTKGGNIFGSDDKDKTHASMFLILLLHYIQNWADISPLAEDLKSASAFSKGYQALKAKRILFPRECSLPKIRSIINIDSSVAELNQQNQFQQQNRRPTAPAQASPQQRSLSQNKERQDLRKQHRQIAEGLKDKMMQARDISKKSEQFLSKLERNGFEYDKNEMVEMDIQLQAGREQCEYCIKQLTNEEINQLITNYESLLNKMMGYQEQILTASSIIQPFSDEIKKNERAMYEQIQSKVKQERGNAQPQIKRNNSYKGGNLLLAELDNFQPVKAKPQDAEEEKGGDDLWSNLDDFATQYQNEMIQSQKNEGNKQDDFNFPIGKLHEIAQKYDDDPFADAVKESMQNQNQGVPAEDFFGGFNQNHQQQQNQAAYDFGFNQSQPQMQQQYQQPDPQHQDDQITGKLFEVALGGPIKAPEKQESPPKPETAHHVKKLWEADLEEFSTHNLNQSQNVQNQQFQQQHNQTDYNTIEQALQLKKLEREVNDLRAQNQRLKDRDAYNQGMTESYTELNRQYKQIQQQVESERQYYKQQIYERDSLLQQKDNQLEQLQKEVHNLNAYIHDLEYKLNTGGSVQQEYSKEQEQPKTQFQTTNEIWLRSPGKSSKQSPGEEERDNSYQSQKSQSPSHKMEDFNTSQNVQYQQEFQSNLQVETVHQAENSQEESSSPKLRISQKSPSSDQKDEQLKKTLDTLFFKALFFDKSKVYEDTNIQIGCIRNISEEWKTAIFKLYIGNKSDQKQITNLRIETFQQTVKIQNGPIAPLLQPKGQREVQILVSGYLDDMPSIMISYQLGEKNSGNIQLRLPCNPFFYCTPFQVTAQNFNLLWQYYKNKRNQNFNMDLSKAANIQQLKQVISLNEKHASFIQGVDEKPNVVAFACQHAEGQVLIKIELSANGKDCKAEVTLENTTELSQRILETVVDLIGQK